jgi:hypothetical protein
MFRVLIAVFVILVVSGCASGARSDQMSVFVDASITQAKTPLRNNVAVKDVTGGKETNPLWASNIGSAEFEQALEASLRSAGILSNGKQAGTHFLTAHLSKVDQPLLGLSMTVTATIEYILVERATGKNVYAKTITLPYTASFGAAFSGVERLRLANEGAAKANIKQLIDELVALNLTDVSLK